MSRRTSKTLAVMICINVLLVVMTAVFAFLYKETGESLMLTLQVTFLTIAYHFAMRLIVGEAVTIMYRNRSFNLNSVGFRMHGFEPELYKKIKVKSWKKSIITAKPEQFDVKENSPEMLLHNIAQAELVHRIIMVLSFVPLILIIPYGAPAIFIITSVFSCMIDLQFVIIQRYNRPRVIRLIEMNKKQKNKSR